MRSTTSSDQTAPRAPVSPLGAQARFEVDKGEPPAKRQIHEGQRPIGDVHGADDVEVRWHKDPLAIRPAVGQLDGLFPPPLRRLDEGQQLTEYLRGVAAVDLLDDEHERTVGLAAGRLHRLHEDAVDEFEALLPLRPPPPHEILVGQRRVELDDTQPRPGRLPIAGSDQRIAQTLCEERLPRAGRALEDQVPLGSPAGQHVVQALGRYEGPLRRRCRRPCTSGPPWRRPRPRRVSRQVRRLRRSRPVAAANPGLTAYLLAQ